MTLFDWLVQVMKYSEAYAEEVIYLYESDFDLPIDVINDFMKWAEYRENMILAGKR